MKTLIFYYSNRQGNTKKLLDSIAEAGDVALKDVRKKCEINLDEYDLIGFASGIYMGRFHRKVIKCAKKLPEGKNTFLIYTYGSLCEGYTDKIKTAILSKNCTIKGDFGCIGSIPSGPLKTMGNVEERHPNQNDINNAVNFYKELIKK